MENSAEAKAAQDAALENDEGKAKVSRKLQRIETPSGIGKREDSSNQMGPDCFVKHRSDGNEMLRGEMETRKHTKMAT